MGEWGQYVSMCAGRGQCTTTPQTPQSVTYSHGLLGNGLPELRESPRQPPISVGLINIDFKYESHVNSLS